MVDEMQYNINRYDLIERNHFIDFAKGIAIFLVLWGHSIQYLSCEVGEQFYDDVVFKIIYSFHMPLFMYLSGYVFYYSCKKRTLQQTLVCRVKNIGVPLLAWGTIKFICNLLVTLFQSVQSGVKGLFACLWYNFIGGEWFVQIFDNAKSIWFLWAVLMSSVMVSIAYHWFPNRKGVQMTVLFTGLFVMFTTEKYIYTVFVYPYFVLGFLVNEFHLDHKRLFRRVSITAIPIWMAMLLAYRREHYIYTSGILPESIMSLSTNIEQFKVDMFRWFVGLLGTLAILELMRLGYQFIQSKKLKEWCECLGKNSLQLYLISGYLVVDIPSICNKIVARNAQTIFMRNRILYDWIVTPIFALGIAVVTMKISLLLSKSRRLNFVLFGR